MNISKNILSDITVHMKYARYRREFQRRETWKEIVDRNKQMHLDKFPHLAAEINAAYEYVYTKKVLPSMRSLQFGGEPIVKNNTRINNCSYLPIDNIAAFSEMMFLLLSGCGVGFSVQKSHIDKLPEIKGVNKTRNRRFLVGDSIEGWSDAIKVLIEAYVYGKSMPLFDYSDIRPKGAELITAGGKAPGPQPLKDCIHNIIKILDAKEQYSKLSPIEVHDICCYLADAVLAGGIRRAALISLFSFDDEEMIACKSGNWWELNPQRGRANNSAVLKRNQIQKNEFYDLLKKVENSHAGEPGWVFIEDGRYGTNPCCEISLREFTFCNLCEINGSTIVDQQDFIERCKAAALIGTLQASYTNFHYLREIWRRNTEKDALIGIGITGIASISFNIDLEAGATTVKSTNAEYAKILGINPAARTTTVKPSGTSSCVLASSSGIHAWHSEYYIRRIRVGKNEPIYQYLNIFHPELVEDEMFRPNEQAVISIPQYAGEGAITREVETLTSLCERIKKYNLEWVRNGHNSGPNFNNVSATVSIKDEEWSQAVDWFWNNREVYTGISVLPYDNGSYAQAPFESITKEKFDELAKTLTAINLENVVELVDNTDQKGEVACAGGACELV